MSFRRAIKSAIFLFLFWLILTGNVEFSNLFLGLVCSFLVVIAAHGLLKENIGLEETPIVLIRFILFMFWLIIEIAKSNIDVAERVLNPRLPIEPAIVKYSCHLKNDDHQTLLGNAITLTPGTLTVDIDESGVYYIHCLADKHAKDLMERKLEGMVTWVFKGVKG
ncbi:Na+/H+ antiporter subunit E [Candidatus Oleimmundimicrobium sp.]|uniref:Na+/H+ antiporter subunit E n=1 Tax=Candidatus Oleimmundimicrobium sp. TaxID=3060597 RepID=UPI0027254B92|nr:Na+/H+ antiporter subunit E [Candidatus Oleimmundimicrobium sp.]MDO8885880.1 Na+/H+ antiporter subunit E [Candidatus Oleimmundimicrobium sp.]